MNVSQMVLKRVVLSSFKHSQLMGLLGLLQVGQTCQEGSGPGGYWLKSRNVEVLDDLGLRVVLWLNGDLRP